MMGEEEIKSNENTFPFIPLDLLDPQCLGNVVKVLEQRLPSSSHIYNMAVGWPKWSERNLFFRLELAGEETNNLTEQSWILVTSFREDRGADINISPPMISPSEDPCSWISPEIKEAFASTCLIDWDKPYLFPGADRTISRMIFEISAYVKGNSTRLSPCHIFYAEPTQALAYQIEKPFGNAEIYSLNQDVNKGVDFLLEEWKYAVEGTKGYLQKILPQNDSMGVWIDGDVVCGVITHVNGMIGMLNTKEGSRRKGYAQICMKSLMKAQAGKGLIPCSAAEIGNQVSIKMHQKVGMKLSHFGDYISSNGKSSTNAQI